MQVVYESLVVVDFIDNVSGATGKDRLVSEDPILAAQSRIWADKVNRDCCSPYYGVLVRKEEHERREHFEKLLRGLQVRTVPRLCSIRTRYEGACQRTRYNTENAACLGLDCKHRASQNG